MAYAIAGIDVHKRMLAVVVADLAAAGEDAFERRQFGSTPAQLRLLADWLSEHQVDEVVRESTPSTVQASTLRFSWSVLTQPTRPALAWWRLCQTSAVRRPPSSSATVFELMW
jgi:hypothetical protein